MHRTIGFLSKRFVQVRPGEGKKVSLAFLYFFLIITAYYLIKPVSRSLVLGELGSRVVPYVDLVAAILMGPVVTLFAWLVDRLRKPHLVSAWFWAVIGVLILFWKLLASPLPWIAGLFYIWVAIFSVLVVTLFWLVANDLFRPRDAKRLFGLIGSGGILGGIVGSSIAAVGAQLIGTEHLLLLSAAVLFACWLVVQRLWTFALEPHAPVRPRRAPSHPDASRSHPTRFGKVLLQSRYLLLLVAMVALNKLVATLVYYQLNPFIELTFPDPDAKTTFTGIFLGGVNILAFIIQFFFTSWVLRRWGLQTALFTLPVGLLLGSGSLLFVPVFWVAAATELFDGSMNYSLQQTTKEVLYLPIDRSIRYKVKPFIDMVVFRFGKGIAAVIGIVLLDWLHVPSRYLSCIIVPMILAWLAVAVWLRRDYVTGIRTLLQAYAASRRRRNAPPDSAGLGPSVPLAGPADPEPFGSLMDSQPCLRKLVLLDQLVDVSDAVSSHARELIAALTAYETHMAAPWDLGAEPHRLKAVIGDQGQPMAKRRQAIRILTRSLDQATVDYLFGLVTVEPDAILRQEAVRGLVRLRLRGGRLDFPTHAIRRQVAAEVADHQRIIKIAEVYRQHHRGPLLPEDPLISLLCELMGESVEQVFRLLMLLYRAEDIHLVYEQMQASEVHVRTDAIELLDNLVDPAMRQTFAPLFDEDRFLSILTDGPAVFHEPTAAYRLLQGVIWDHNCWLSITTLCAVGRLRLTTMQQELEKASRDASPPISTAAKVALHLSVRP